MAGCIIMYLNLQCIVLEKKKTSFILSYHYHSSFCYFFFFFFFFFLFFLFTPPPPSFSYHHHYDDHFHPSLLSVLATESYLDDPCITIPNTGHAQIPFPNPPLMPRPGGENPENAGGIFLKVRPVIMLNSKKYGSSRIFYRMASVFIYLFIVYFCAFDLLQLEHCTKYVPYLYVCVQTNLEDHALDS